MSKPSPLNDLELGFCLTGEAKDVGWWEKDEADKKRDLEIMKWEGHLWIDNQDKTEIRQ